MNVRIIILAALTAAAAPLPTEPPDAPAPTRPPALADDPPPIEPPGRGDIRGAIQPAGHIRSLHAVHRATGQIVRPKTLNTKTGRFLFQDLPGDATYDLVVHTTDGRTIEGIDLGRLDDRLLRMAAARRGQLHLPPEPTHAFRREDAEELLTFVRDAEEFMDLRRVLYVQGHGRRATMLLELLRVRDFYDAQGTIVWRVELWYFEYQHGGWEKLPNQERVLRRQRISPAQWRRISVQYTPELSVHVGPNGHAPKVDYTLPKEPDPSRGRPANTDPKLKTPPYILGLDVTDDEPGAEDDGNAAEPAEAAPPPPPAPPVPASPDADEPATAPDA